MAEARSLFDRSQLKANDNIHGRSPSVSYLGSLATRRNVSCSSGDDGPIYMLSSNLACHSAGLSVHDLFTDIELDSPAGHLATSKHVCLLGSFLTQILIRKHWTAHFTRKEKITKTRPWSGRGQRRGEIRQHDEGTLLLSFAFFFLIRLLRNVCCVWFTASVLCVWGGNHERGGYV